MVPDREQALELLRRYNKDEGHINHGLAVEAVMRHMAARKGGDEDLWGVVGLLHDLDWEQTEDDPQQHTARAVEWLRGEGYPEELVRAVRSHGWGLVQDDVPPESEMEKTLYAVDELTGFVIAVALVRPSRSTKDMKLKSVKKKWKDKAFARGVDREVIQKGADMLGVSMDELIQETIEGLRPVEERIGLGA
ncbi:MAG: HDIG domain-containing protein [Synergistales bacterium]|nr:HDIG domain-containing protein [Synergistales bacterium]